MAVYELKDFKYEVKGSGNSFKPHAPVLNWFFIHGNKGIETFNGIPSGVYSKLVDFMNNCEQFSLSLHQCEGTTTDFIIVKGRAFNGIREMKQWIKTCENKYSTYKYLIADYETGQIERFM